jgi:hypothetical protein
MTPVAFPAHALLVLEERLRDDQAEGMLPANVDITLLALKILLCAHRVLSPTSILTNNG